MEYILTFSVKVLLVECVNLLRQIWPRQGPSEFFSQFALIAVSALLCEFDLPAAQVIQQPHIWLDEHG